MPQSRNRRRAPPAVLQGPLALEAIWRAVRGIPRGTVASYGEVARQAGLAGRARLVGFALRNAPQGLALPWHRVVGSGGRISFPPGTPSHAEQARRLRLEGLRIVRGRIVGADLARARTLDRLLWKPRP